MDKKEINSPTLTVNCLMWVGGAGGLLLLLFPGGRFYELEIESYRLVLNSLSGKPPTGKLPIRQAPGKRSEACSKSPIFNQDAGYLPVVEREGKLGVNQARRISPQ